MVDKVTESIINLAREGYMVTLGPSPLGGRDLNIEVVGGHLHSRKIISGVTIDYSRVDAVAMMIEQVLREFGEILECEVRGEG